MKRTLLLGVLALVVISNRHALGQENQTETAALTNQPLQIESRSIDSFSGSLIRNSQRIRFEARVESGTRTISKVWLDNDVFDAEVDLVNKSAVLDGHGRVLSVHDIETIIALGMQLEEAILAESRPPAPHEDMLYRLLSAYSMGMAGGIGGQPMGRLEVTANFSVCDPVAFISPFPICGEPAGSTEPEYFIDCDPFLPFCEALATDADDGICYLGGSGDNDGCPCAYYALAHDEYNYLVPFPGDHCYCTEIVGAGCNRASDCRGRGGDKCTGDVPGLDCLLGGSLTGAGAYTKDFAEHDRCCDLHEGIFCAGPWCATEAIASLDDCLMAKANCEQGCCAVDSDCLASQRCEPHDPLQPELGGFCMDLDCEECNEVGAPHQCTDYDCCETNADCGSGGSCMIGLCIDDVCEYSDATCTIDDDCVSPDNPCGSCVDGCCIALPTCSGTFCADECSEISLCIDGCCDSVPECTVNSDCSDGILCTVDRCIDGCCVNEGECSLNSDCDDGNACTTDSCFLACCQNTPECESDDDCSQSGTCHKCENGCCLPDPVCTSAADCDDNNPCTNDSCDSGCCTYTSASSCGDGVCDAVCGENCLSCPQDCHECSDGCCDASRGEDRCNCPQDCATNGVDCNLNGVLDDCEITGNDCNSNGTLDECELEGNDCNFNLIPDDCEDNVTDCNTNGWIDLCELAAPRLRFMGLGDLPGGDTISAASSVTDDGSIVVGWSRNAFGREGFRWTEHTGMVGIGDLPGGAHESSARQISPDGSRVIGWANNTLGNVAMRWTEAEGIVSLGDFSGGIYQSFALDLTPDGSVIVGNGHATDARLAARWTSDSMIESLDDLPGGIVSSRAYAVTDDGNVIVGQATSGSGREAFLWTASTGIIGLGDFPGGGFDSEAYDVSADGMVVGHGESTSGTEAMRWTESEGMVGLGDLPGGAFESIAYAISDDGRVIVGSAQTEAGREAFIWTAAHGMRSLKVVLENDYGLDLTGWRLSRPNDISPDGNIIVGRADSNPQGFPEAFIVTFSPQPRDCNSNALLDECELAGNDCDANGILDTCQPDLDGDGIPNACDPCAGGNASGDIDGDGDVDLGDFEESVSCFLGPDTIYPVGCECVDFDLDGDVDMRDFAEFQGRVANP